jgi:hypothetical protein
MAKTQFGKRNFFIRYLLLIKCLRNKRHASFEEIKDFVAKDTALLDNEYIYEIRTFQRDLNDIRSIFNIDIKCNRSTNEYHIVEDEQNSFNTRLLESFDIFTSLTSIEALSGIIAIERKCKQGTEYMHGLIYAIKNNFIITIGYQKYDTIDTDLRELKPLALKEFKGRWYLITMTIENNAFRTFALDRIKGLNISSLKFERPENFNVDDYFKDCYGVIKPENQTPQEIILSFDAYQGNYLKSYALHHSQIILTDTEQEFRIKIFTYITHDLLMELLSFGNSLKVITPKELTQKLKTMVA